MIDRTVARRYARAFLDLAQDTKQVDLLAADLNGVVEVAFGGEGLLAKVLGNPMFDRKERMGVLDAILPKLEVQPLTANLLHMLVERNKFAALPDIAEIYAGAADEAAGRVKVKVTTAEPLTRDLTRDVKASLERVTGKSVILESSVDKNLIGGMVARIGGKVYDASLRARLVDLQQRLLRNQPAEA